MDQRDLQILAELENGLPLVPEPFEEIGKRLGMTGEEVLGRLEGLRGAGIIRRFRARINQRQLWHHRKCPCCMGLQWKVCR